MNRRSFLRAATGCALAVGAGQAVEFKPGNTISFDYVGNHFGSTFFVVHIDYAMKAIYFDSAQSTLKGKVLKGFADDVACVAPNRVVSLNYTDADGRPVVLRTAHSIEDK